MRGLPGSDAVPQREFRDDRGITWLVWDAHPTMAERRRARVPIPPDYRERRLTRVTRVPVAAELAQGWLVFRTAGQRRRMAPIPSCWADAPDDQLRRWCCEAAPTVVCCRPVGRARRPVTPAYGLALGGSFQRRRGVSAASDGDGGRGAASRSSSTSLDSG